MECMNPCITLLFLTNTRERWPSGGGALVVVAAVSGEGVREERERVLERDREA